MKPTPEVNSPHELTRTTFRVLGPLVLLTGLVFTGIGLVNFFSSMGTFEPPRLFWCAIVGLPITGMGIALTRVGFVGSIVRYYANEVAPVGRDTFNTMAEGTREGIRTIASAATEGISSGLRGESSGESTCPGCAAVNPPGARYCSHCGMAMEAKACPRCGARIAAAAKFCNQCGSPNS